VRDDGAVARLRGRVRRRPAVLGLLTIGVLGAVVIVVLQARPSGSSPTAIRLEQGYAGTTYAFDGAVCLRAPAVEARVLSAEVEQAAGVTARLVQPPEGARPTLGFPAEDRGEDVGGYRVTAGGDDCTLRLLVTPTRQGLLAPGVVRVRLAYGPFDLLRRTVSVRPQVRLDVTAEGDDPRSINDAE
jgi:hypothetical protein